MKSAEEVAQEFLAYWCDEDISSATLAALLTAFAEERVKEATKDSPTMSLFVHNKLLAEARSAALEEAAKIAESIYGTQFHDKVERRTGNKIALNVRALKGKP